MIPRIVAKSVYSFFLFLIFIKTVAKSFVACGSHKIKSCSWDPSIDIQFVKVRHGFYLVV